MLDILHTAMVHIHWESHARKSNFGGGGGGGSSVCAIGCGWHGWFFAGMGWPARNAGTPNLRRLGDFRTGVTAQGYRDFANPPETNPYRVGN